MTKDQNEGAADFFHCFNLLNAKERRAIMLHYFIGKVDRECAEEMGMSVSGFRKLRLRALKYLREVGKGSDFRGLLPGLLGSAVYKKGSQWLSTTEKLAMDLFEVNGYGGDEAI